MSSNAGLLEYLEWRAKCATLQSSIAEKMNNGVDSAEMRHLMSRVDDAAALRIMGGGAPVNETDRGGDQGGGDKGEEEGTSGASGGTATKKVMNRQDAIMNGDDVGFLDGIVRAVHKMNELGKLSWQKKGVIAAVSVAGGVASHLTKGAVNRAHHSMDAGITLHFVRVPTVYLNMERKRTSYKTPKEHTSNHISNWVCLVHAPQVTCHAAPLLVLYEKDVMERVYDPLMELWATKEKGDMAAASSQDLLSLLERVFVSSGSDELDFFNNVTQTMGKRVSVKHVSRGSHNPHDGVESGFDVMSGSNYWVAAGAWRQPIENDHVARSWLGGFQAVSVHLGRSRPTGHEEAVLHDWVNMAGLLSNLIHSESGRRTNIVMATTFVMELLLGSPTSVPDNPVLTDYGLYDRVSARMDNLPHNGVTVHSVEHPPFFRYQLHERYLEHPPPHVWRLKKLLYENVKMSLSSHLTAKPPEAAHFDDDWFSQNVPFFLRNSMFFQKSKTWAFTLCQVDVLGGVNRHYLYPYGITPPKLATVRTTKEDLKANWSNHRERFEGAPDWPDNDADVMVDDAAWVTSVTGPMHVKQSWGVAKAGRRSAGRLRSPQRPFALKEVADDETAQREANNRQIELMKSMTWERSTDSALAILVEKASMKIEALAQNNNKGSWRERWRIRGGGSNEEEKKEEEDNLQEGGGADFVRQLLYAFEVDVGMQR